MNTSSEFKQFGQFNLIPDHKEITAPYRKMVDDHKKDTGSKLTDSQHHIAKEFGFKDWQSLTYRFKQTHDALTTIDLTDGEWGFIFDVSIGWAIGGINNKDSLLMNIIDGDRYDSLSGKWFSVSSKADNFEDTWEPSDPMRTFVEKIQNATDDQIDAITMKALLFWDRYHLVWKNWKPQSPFEIDRANISM